MWAIRWTPVPAVVSVVLVTAAGTAVGEMPAPSEDPFYQAPVGYESQPDGTILRSRPVSATALSVPLPVDSWQLLYKSLDSRWR
ncbi:hypothetical protein ACH47B_23315 [Rhodococcus sp. NPDC019627]|uniref:hypothetical protein n=1 Tax=unclassified Rhodococcus (in: high G+C Gram-positive bacteria) TaxID=192944 RepID=UPI0034104BC2